MASTKDETKTSKFESNRQNPKEQILPNKQFDVFILHTVIGTSVLTKPILC